MNLFQIYMVFFGFTTIIGVPLLSSFQVTQIKGSTWADWVSSLGASLGPAAGIFVIITIVSYIIMKPLLEIINNSKTQEITDEEKHSVEKILRKVRILATVALMSGYPVGNGATIIIKTIAGKVNYSTQDLLIIMVLIFSYGFLAVQYAVNCFMAVARKELLQLHISSADGFKHTKVSETIAESIIFSVLVISWHVFCSGYSAIRNDWDMQLFLHKVTL